VNRTTSIAVYVTPTARESDPGEEPPAARVPMIRARLFMPGDVAPNEGRVFVDLPALPPVGTHILHDGFERLVDLVLLETGNPTVSLYLEDL
jgi:hypothetical protein